MKRGQNEEKNKFVDQCMAVSSGKGSLIRCHAFLMCKERSRLPGDRAQEKRNFITIGLTWPTLKNE